MKRPRWQLVFGIIVLLVQITQGFDHKEANEELNRLLDTLQDLPRATIPELEELDQVNELEQALENEDHKEDGEYAEQLLTAIKSVRARYDRLRAKWESTIDEKSPIEEGPEVEGLEDMDRVEIRRSPARSPTNKKRFGPLSRARALSANTVFQKPIAMPSGWSDFENDADFEEISAPDMKIEMEARTTTSNVQFIPKTSSSTASTTRTSTTTKVTPTTTRKSVATQSTTVSTSTVISSTTSTTATTTRISTTPTTKETTTQPTTAQTTEQPPTKEASTPSVPVTIGWKPKTPPPPRAPSIWTPKVADTRVHKPLLNDPRSLEKEIDALMDLWEKGPLSQRLKAADDQRIERLLSRKDLDKHARNILVGKRRLRRLLILSRLFEDRSRILVLVESQRKNLREVIKRAQHRVPKSAPRQGKDTRQVSRSRVNTIPSEMLDSRWPAVKESFQAPVFNPNTDTLDSAVERGFVETDPEFFGRRPRRKLSRHGPNSRIFARLLKVQNRKHVDERNAKIISLRDLSSESREHRRKKGKLNAEKEVSKEENVETTEKSRETTKSPKLRLVRIESGETHKEPKIRSSKAEHGTVLEMCSLLECDFEKGDLCNWESSADELDTFSRRSKRSEEFSIRAWSNVEGRPDRTKAMERNPIFSSINHHFAGAYVNGSQVATLSIKIPQTMPVTVRFLAWEATRMVRLRACCDDFCPFSTEEGVKRGHRKWMAHSVICPAHTKQVTFECVNTGVWSGRCGLDSIHFRHPLCPDLLPYTEDQE